MRCRAVSPDGPMGPGRFRPCPSGKHVECPCPLMGDCTGAFTRHDFASFAPPHWYGAVRADSMRCLDSSMGPRRFGVKGAFVCPLRLARSRSIRLPLRESASLASPLPKYVCRFDAKSGRVAPQRVTATGCRDFGGIDPAFRQAVVWRFRKALRRSALTRVGKAPTVWVRSPSMRRAMRRRART